MYNNGLPYPPQQPSMHFPQAAGPPRPPAQHFPQSWQPAGAAVPPGSFQPSAPQQFAADPNAFAGMFQAHLATLTFNSKPIITNLTVMAHENAGQMANTVARCIDEHITQSPPPYRLPALYLLDSISKNVGQPYCGLWAQRIAHLFLETYRMVDQPTKVRMEELLNTWRQGARDGTPLFGGDAQWDIERNLYGSQGPPPMARPVATQHLNPVPASNFASSSRASGSRSPQPPQRDERSRAVEQIDRLLAQGAQEPRSSLASPTRIAALRQLRTVVQSVNLSQQEMSQIQAQLAALAKEATPSVATPPPPPPVSAPSLPNNLSEMLANISRMTPQPPSNDAASTATSQRAENLPESSAGSNDLIRSLMAAGLIPASKENAPAAPSIVEQPAWSLQDADYTQALLSMPTDLSSTSLQQELSSTKIDLMTLSKHLPLQCRQCANRYPGGNGQKRLDQHLDWHFRQNRRAKDSSARGSSRSWLDRARDWIKGAVGDVGTSGTNDTNGAAGGNGKALSAQQEQELAAHAQSWIAAPTDARRTNEPCPICKEKFTSEWSEDEEEWIWRNAVLRKTASEGSETVVYHGTCYYSAKVLSANAGLAAGGEGSMGPRRSATAERRSRTATPPLTSAVQSGTTAADPIQRIKSEAINPDTSSSPSSASAEETSRKRKESPALAATAATQDGINGSAADGEPATKRVAL